MGRPQAWARGLNTQPQGGRLKGAIVLPGTPPQVEAGDLASHWIQPQLPHQVTFSEAGGFSGQLALSVPCTGAHRSEDSPDSVGCVVPSHAHTCAPPSPLSFTPKETERFPAASLRPSLWQTGSSSSGTFFLWGEHLVALLAFKCNDTGINKMKSYLFWVV